MERLKIINNLKVKEEQLQTFSNVLTDLKSNYFKEGYIYFEIDSNDFNRRHGSDNAVTFNKTLLMSYIDNEISQLEKEIQNLIINLKGE